MRWAVVLACLIFFYRVVEIAYIDYTPRAQVAEAITLMGAAKAPLAEYFSSRKKWPAKLDDVVGRTRGKYTASVVITKGAGGSGEAIELTATMSAEGVSEGVAGGTARMSSADGGRNWTCGPGTLPLKYLPNACRN